MTFAVDRIDHVVLNCRDVEQTVDWYARVLGPGSLDLCFIADVSADEVGTHLRACGVQITEVAKIGAQGPMTPHYCRDPDGNLVEVASYRAPD